MIRRLTSLAAAGLLALSLLGTTGSIASASIAPQRADPAIRTDWRADCNDTDAHDYLTGQASASTTVTRSGARADLTWSPAADFQMCHPHTQFPSDIWGGVAAYVEVSPLNQPSVCAPTGCAIRLGVAQCDSFGTDACQSPDTYFWYWQYLGCGQNNVKQGITKITNTEQNNVTSLEHDVAIWEDASGVWNFTIDGTTFKRLANTWSGISCWINNSGPRKAAFIGRKWDEAGDSLGYYDEQFPPGDWGVRFRDARYGVNGQGWLNPSWAAQECIYEHFRDTCKVTNSDEVRIYTR